MQLFPLAFALAAASGVHGIGHNDYYLKHLRTLAVSANAPAAQYIEIPVDHFGSTKGTFLNRYWYNDQYYKSGGPVIIYDVGEADASLFVNFLEEDVVTSAVMELAHQYNGIGIIWEHRNYGTSLIGNVKSVQQYTEAQWRLHTVDQALEDVVYFSGKFATASVSNGQLNPSKTPWIFLGGSYPGMRAALLRVRNPDVIFASWASSAPVEAQIDMSSYWRTIQNAIPSNCSTDLVAMASFVDSAFLGNNQTLAQAVKAEMLKAHRGGTLEGVTQEQFDALDYAAVAGYLKDPLSNWQSKGLTLGYDVCDYLETGGDQVTASANGIVAEYGINPFFSVWTSVVTILQSPASSAASVQPGNDVQGQTFRGAPRPQWTDTLPAPVRFDKDSTQLAAEDQDQDALISWLWQVCNEFGFYQVTDSKHKSMLSSLFTLEYFQKTFCDEQFNGMAPSKPQVENVNKYGGWGMNPSRVFFTAGEIDPWTTLSVASGEDNAPGRSASASVPAANAGAPTGAFFGVVYPKTVHAADLATFTSSDASHQAAYAAGIALFTKALDVWLPSFGTSSGGNGTTGTNTGTSTSPRTGTVTRTASTSTDTSTGSSGGGTANAAAWHRASWETILVTIALAGTWHRASWETIVVTIALAGALLA